jgi:hypothetical protein
MLSDPQTVAINGVSYDLPRVTSDGKKSTYQDSDIKHVLTVSHQESKGRVRSMVRLDEKKLVTNPIDSSTDFDSLGTYLVIDRPLFGFSVAEAQQLVYALQALIDSAMVSKLYGLQS